MLRLALLLLGWALSRYLRAISCVVARVIVAITFLGVILCGLFTLAVTIPRPPL